MILRIKATLRRWALDNKRFDPPNVNICSKDIIDLYKKEDHCSKTGKKFTFSLCMSKKMRDRYPNNLVFEMIDPNLGYIVNNIRLVCCEVAKEINTFGWGLYEHRPLSPWYPPDCPKKDKPIRNKNKYCESTDLSNKKTKTMAQTIIIEDSGTTFESIIMEPTIEWQMATIPEPVLETKSVIETGEMTKSEAIDLNEIVVYDFRFSEHDYNMFISTYNPDISVTIPISDLLK